MKRLRSLSLNKRIALIPVSIFVPMLIVVLYLVMMMLHYADAYSAITGSVTYANRYSREFKERMDYSMYLSVISNKTTEELGNGQTTVNGIVTVDPYVYIDELTAVCDDLSRMATVSINRTQIIFVKNSLNSLRKRVSKLEEMIVQKESYDDKMNYLDQNISGASGLTAVIQRALQDYVYHETTNFEDVKAELEKQIRYTLQLGILVIVAAIMIALILSALTVRSVTGPIKKLCSQTRKVAKGDFTAQANITAVDEIAVLTDSFNTMTAEIGTLIDNIKKHEVDLRVTESKLLQAQINPHFLYNTLDTIVWLAEEKKGEEVVLMVTALSEFFRTTLSKGRDYITIKEEKFHIESYLKIQQFRYQDIMDYQIDIKEEIYDCLIPKLTLQPLVENALYHGIKNQRDKGLIRITGWREGKRIFLQVADNGVGMSMSKLDKLRKNIDSALDELEQSGFGLANVNQRIQYYYGKEYGVFLESNAGKGTEVTVIIEAKNI